MVDEHLAETAPAEDHLIQMGRRADIGGGLLEERLAGERGEWRLLARLPDDGIAAHQRDRGVPRPDGDGEVERRDHCGGSVRVPRLHQPVARPLGGDGSSGELPRQPDGELADVDHLLDLAEAFRADLADLDRDELAEVVLVLTEQFAEPSHQSAPDGCGRVPPTGECVLRPADRVDHVSWRVSGEPAELAPGDRCAGRDGAVLVQFRLGAATPQGGQRSPA